MSHRPQVVKEKALAKKTRQSANVTVDKKFWQRKTKI